MDNSTPSEYLKEFNGLTLAQQAQVMSFIRQLKVEAAQRGKSREERNAALLALAGSISHEDIQLMMAAIEEDCERIDDDQW